MKANGVIMKQRYTVTIADIELNVYSEESPEYTKSLAKAVDERIREAQGPRKNISVVEAMLFSSLSLLDENVKYAQKINAQKQEIEKLKEQLAKLTAKEPDADDRS